MLENSHGRRQNSNMTDQRAESVTREAEKLLESAKIFGAQNTSQGEVADWEQELAGQPHLQKVENWQHFLAMKFENETGMTVQWRNGLGDHQHMSKALSGAGKLQYLQYYIATDMSVVHGVFFFSGDMVSFPGVLHGGSQFFAYDETCGQLAFLVLPGGCVTVQSEILFKKPFPAGKSKAIITAQVDKIEGRKAFLRATLRDAPNGTIYSEIRMTYVKMPENIKRQASLNLKKASKL